MHDDEAIGVVLQGELEDLAWADAHSIERASVQLGAVQVPELVVGKQAHHHLLLLLGDMAAERRNLAGTIEPGRTPEALQLGKDPEGVAQISLRCGQIV